MDTIASMTAHDTRDAFGTLLQEETAAVKKSDFKTVDALQAEKRQFAALYAEMVQALSQRKDEMPLLDPAMRDTLIRARTEFTITLQHNLRALENMKRSAQRLANRILEAARHAVKDECQTNYSAKGQVQAYKTSTLSLRMDEML